MDRHGFLGGILASYIKINVFLSVQVESTLAPKTAASQQHRVSDVAQTPGDTEDKVEMGAWIYTFFTVNCFLNVLYTFYLLFVKGSCSETSTTTSHRECRPGGQEEEHRGQERFGSCDLFIASFL